MLSKLRLGDLLGMQVVNGEARMVNSKTTFPDLTTPEAVRTEVESVGRGMTGRDP